MRKTLIILVIVLAVFLLWIRILDVVYYLLELFLIIVAHIALGMAG